MPPDLQETSIFSALIECKELPNATILVTSRTSSSDVVYEKCKFQYIEVVGFTREQIESCINNTVTDEEDLETLPEEVSPHSWLNVHSSQLWNCFIDVFILSSDDKEPPTTQTELYTVLIKTILCRYLSSHPVYEKQRWCLSGFSDLPLECPLDVVAAL